jgi:hypothetical protein
MLVALEREAEGHAMCKDPGRWDVPNRCHRDLRLFCRALFYFRYFLTHHATQHSFRQRDLERA